jgi:hypothetical protein
MAVLGVFYDAAIFMQGTAYGCVHPLGIWVNPFLEIFLQATVKTVA